MTTDFTDRKCSHFNTQIVTNMFRVCRKNEGFKNNIEVYFEEIVTRLINQYFKHVVLHDNQ